MPTEQQLIQAYQSLGWTDIGSILGDIRAGHWQDKWNNYQGIQGGGGQQGGSQDGSGYLESKSGKTG